MYKQQKLTMGPKGGMVDAQRLQCKKAGCRDSFAMTVCNIIKIIIN